MISSLVWRWMLWIRLLSRIKLSSSDLELNLMRCRGGCTANCNCWRKSALTFFSDFYICCSRLFRCCTFCTMKAATSTLTDSSDFSLSLRTDWDSSGSILSSDCCCKEFSVMLSSCVVSPQIMIVSFLSYSDFSANVNLRTGAACLLIST